MKHEKTRKTRVTIRDVAREAGVSPTAVSFAFNAPEQLSEATYEHIIEVAGELHYQPHPVARTLATGRTDTIGLVLPASINWTLQDPFFCHFIGELGRLCDQHHQRILLVPLWEDTEVMTLNSIAVDGFIVVGLSRNHPLSAIVEQSVRPILLFDCDSSIQAPKVALDNFQGAYMAATHLIEQGHRQLAVSAMKNTPNGQISNTFQERVEGYRQAVIDAELPVDALSIVYTEYAPQSSDPIRQSFHDIWALGQRPTAVLCVSDERALEIISSANAADVRVPADLAVVGFDDIPEAATATPPLTTVSQDIAGRCTNAFHRLMSYIEKSTGGEWQVAGGGWYSSNGATGPDPVELVIRKSG